MVLMAKTTPEPPVKVGETIKRSIVSFGKNGDPIMKVDRYVLFIKETKGKKFALNDLIEVKVTKVLPNYGFAELV